MLDRPHRPPILHAETHLGFRALPRDFWDSGSGDGAEDWAYYRACEAAGGAPASASRVIVVSDERGAAAAAPIFEMRYPLDTPLQGRLAGPVRVLRRCAPNALEWKALGVGSALTERGHLALRPGLTTAARDAALDRLVDTVESEARRSNAAVVAFKDLAPSDERLLGPRLAARSYVAIRSLPVAVLDLGAARTAEDYLAGLSASTRKDIRRKLKSRDRLRIEHRTTLGEALGNVRALYRETRAASEVRYGDFEELPDGYFDRMAALGPEHARFVLYWAGERLIAFNLLLLSADRVIDKYIGMSHPLAQDHDVYAVSWMENVAVALGSGRRYLETGQTAYGEKLRFGSTLEPRTVYAKHRFPPLNAALRKTAGLLAFDRWDPVLRRLARGR